MRLVLYKKKVFNVTFQKTLFVILFIYSKKLEIMNAIIVLSEVAMKVVNTLESAMNKSKNKITFISLKNYKNSSNEVSNNIVNIGIKYENQKIKDIEFLKTLDIQSISFKSSLIDIEKARISLIESFLKPNENRSNGQKNAYYHINNAIKVHVETGEIFIYGYREHKEVLIEGESKKTSEEFYGRNDQNKVVVFPKLNFKKGEYVHVKIERCTAGTLIGKVIE